MYATQSHFIQLKRLKSRSIFVLLSCEFIALAVTYSLFETSVFYTNLEFIFQKTVL